MTNPIAPGPSNAAFHAMAYIKDLPPSVLSEPLRIFDAGHTTSADVHGESNAATSQTTPRGAIYTNVDPSIKKVYNKFPFSYNPSSINFSTAWDLSKPAFGSGSTGGDSGGAVATIGNLGGVNSPEALGFEIVLNRIVECSLAYNGPGANMFQQYGTIADLSMFFRTINALTDEDITGIINAGNNVGIPPSNPGYLVANNCTLYFGVGNYVWYGYCTGVIVTHAKFINTMVPVLTTLELSFQRTLAPGDTNASDGSSTSGSVPTIDTTGTSVPVGGGKKITTSIVNTPLAQQFNPKQKPIGVLKPGT